jgi:hypothetical protein
MATPKDGYVLRVTGSKFKAINRYRIMLEKNHWKEGKKLKQEIL